jgi:uncharacterized protein (TIGR03435 family)
MKLILFLAVLAAPVFGQPRFDVVSIKPLDPLSTNTHIANTPGGPFEAAGITLQSLITQAYDIPAFQLVGSSGWMQTDRYEIRAKNEKPGPSEADLAKMTDEDRRALHEQSLARLRSLLADRYQLKIHRETKEMPVYVLTVAKGGSKLKTLPANGKPEGNITSRRNSDGQTGIIADKLTTASLAWFLSGVVKRTTLDQTQLNGKYDFTLTYAPEVLTGDIAGPSIFTALEDQLGLSLKPGKGPVDVVVIDSARKPSAN